jgi:hypothetical protein
MPERVYHSYLSIEADRFTAALPKRKQRQILDLADQIARRPFRLGDYQTRDACDRTIENLLIDDCLFSY